MSRISEKALCVTATDVLRVAVNNATSRRAPKLTPLKVIAKQRREK